MVKKKISISYAADKAETFYIENLILTAVARILQENGAKQMKMEMESLPVKNPEFEFQERKVKVK